MRKKDRGLFLLGNSILVLAVSLFVPNLSRISSQTPALDSSQTSTNALSSLDAQTSKPAKSRKPINPDDAQWEKITGRYTDDYAYWFSVKIPKGVVGVLPCCEVYAWHGIPIILSVEPEVYIYVSGDYNARFLTSIDEHVDELIDWVKGSGTNTDVIRREQTSLRGLPAVRLTVRYKSLDTDEIKIEDQIIASRAGEDQEIYIFYSITLYTTEARYNSDVATFESVVDGWRKKPLPEEAFRR